jgi:hypothetical protein
MRLQTAAVTIGKHRGEQSLRQSPPERHTIIVIPAGTASAELQTKHCRWISRGEWSRGPDGVDPLLAVLDELELPAPAQGLAAIRLWGQTGARPEGWVSAADPVYLEALLDHVRLHALDEDALGRKEREHLFEYLQAQLGNAGHRFELVGELGYVRGERDFATASCSAVALDSRQPDAFLPSAAASWQHDRLVGELQLLLHQAPFNRRREEQGRLPVNSIWLWGGGCAPPASTIALPRLFADDPQFLGYWRSVGGEVTLWSGEDGKFPADISRACVAVPPPGRYRPELLDAVLQMARLRLARGQIHRLALVFSDGWRVRLRRWQLLAIWRNRRWPLQDRNSE